MRFEHAQGNMLRELDIPEAGVSLRDRCLALADRLLASHRFQRWAAKFPLTRPIARGRTRALFDLCAGFVYSQILLACVRLRLFDLLFDEARSATEVARLTSLSEDAARRLLDAAASLRLVERRGRDRYGLGKLGVAMVGSPGITAMIEHNALLYADLEDPVALLRGERLDTRLAAYWPYADAARPSDLPSDGVTAYTKLMAASQPLVAEEILDAYAFGKHRWLLDVGGGDGSFLVKVAQHVPNLRLTLFDLPPVADRARSRFSNLGLTGRAEAVGGDFLDDALPSGPDLVSLVRIIHDHDDESALRILRSIRRMLPAHGRLVVAEPMSGTRGAEPVGDAYFGFYLMAMGRGRPRTTSQLTELLNAAGFSAVRHSGTHTPLLVRVVIARP